MYKLRTDLYILKPDLLKKIFILKKIIKKYSKIIFLFAYLVLFLQIVV